MNRETKKAFTKEVMAKALAKYKIDENTLYSLAGNESFVYGYQFRGKEYVLKLIHSSHRSFSQVAAEIDWIHFLHEYKVPVALPVASHNNYYVERIDCNDSYFSVAAYQKIPGMAVNQRDFTPELIQQWGATMGKMHQAAKRYINPLSGNRRPAWNEHHVFHMVDQLPPSLEPVKHLFNDIIERLEKLPKDKDSYGLVHSDFHHLNFLLKDNQHVIIDFDDSDYNWFMNDIAKTLYNEVFNFSLPPSQRVRFAAFFWEHFMSGYRSENTIDRFWLEYIEDFLKLRRAFIFIKWFLNSNSDSPDSKESLFSANYCKEAAQRRAVLDLPYETLFGKTL